MKTLKETVVRYDTAKLAVSLGFEYTIGVFKGKSYYNQEGELNGDVTYELKNKESKSIPAPTQSLLQKWLRDEHNINIFVYFHFNAKKFIGHAYSMLLDGKGYLEQQRLKKIVKYETYEEALEVALIDGLYLINNKILPCSCCGGEPYLQKTEGCDFVITCQCCGLEMFDDMTWNVEDYDAASNVITKWNNRINIMDAKEVLLETKNKYNIGKAWSLTEHVILEAMEEYAKKYFKRNKKSIMKYISI